MKQFLSLLILAWATPLAAAQGAFLGVELDGSDSSGARVQAVQEPTAASLMGIQAGDVILKVGDRVVADAAGLVAVMQDHLPGEIVELRVLRGTEELSIAGVLGRRPQDRTIYFPQAQARPEGRGFSWDYSEYLPQQPWGEMIIPSPLWEEGTPGWPFVQPDFPGEWIDIPGGFIEFPTLPEIQLDWEEAPGSSWMGKWGEIQERFDVLRESFDREFIGQTPGGERMYKVVLTYPASTPSEQREELIRSAVEEYGEDVMVRFEGEGNSISIHHSYHSDGTMDSPAPPTPPTPPLPPSGKGQEF